MFSSRLAEKRILLRDTTRHSISVISITAKTDIESETRALSAGGVDFIHKPCNAAVVRARARLHLELSNHRNHLEELVHARTCELAAARDAAESTSRAKSVLLATVGHELRTPMNHIIGFKHMLGKEITDEREKGRLEKIQQASRQLLREAVTATPELQHLVNRGGDMNAGSGAATIRGPDPVPFLRMRVASGCAFSADHRVSVCLPPAPRLP